MIPLTARIAVSEDELKWSFARSGGPGGQNVNKVASKAVLSWDLARSGAVPEDVKQRLARLFPRVMTTEGRLVLSSQRYRDQERNRAECLEKLREMLGAASFVPRVRKKTKPTRGAQRRRLANKERRAETKSQRRPPSLD